MKSIKYTAAAIAIAAMGLASCGKDDPTITYNDIENTISGKSELIEEIVNKDVTVQLLHSQEFDIVYSDEIQLAEISDPELSGVVFASTDPTTVAVDNSGKAKVIGYNPEYDLTTVIATYNGKAIEKYDIWVKGKGELTIGEGNSAQTINCTWCEYYIGSNNTISKQAAPGYKHNATLYIETENDYTFYIEFYEDDDKFVWDSKKVISPLGYYYDNDGECHEYATTPKLEFSVENNIIKLTFSAEASNAEKISIKYEGPLSEVRGQ